MEKLKKRRSELNLTYKYVADRVGISKMHYWYIENGKRSLTLDLAKKIAEVLEADPKDLFF